VNGATLPGSPFALSSGTASTTFSESTASTYTLEADYGGDSNYASATVSETLIVTMVKQPVTVSLVPTMSPMTACGGVSFSAQVSSTAGGGPTGTVQLKSGATALTSTTLHNGSATLAANGLSAGPHTFIATYSGDSQHEAGTSVPVSINVKPAGLSCVSSHPPTAGSGSVRIQ
jgi:hypothetical protein